MNAERRQAGVQALRVHIRELAAIRDHFQPGTPEHERMAARTLQARRELDAYTRTGARA